MLYLAVDPGAGNVKICGNFAPGNEDSPAAISSRSLVSFVERSEVQIGSNAIAPDVIRYVIGNRRDLIGKHWVTGDGVSKRGLTPTTAFEEPNLKVANALPATLGTLIAHKVLEPAPKENHIVIVMSHHNPQVMGTQLKTSVSGAHKVESGGKEYLIEFKFPEAAVLAEGSALGTEGENSTLDIGELTTLLTQRWNGEPISTPTPHPYGVGYLIDMLCRHPEVTQHVGGVTADKIRMASALMEASTRAEEHPQGDKVIYRHNKAININPAFGKCLGSWIKLAINPALQALSEKQGLEDYEVLAIGGGVALPRLAKLLTKKGIKIYEGNPLFANAESLYLRHLLPILNDEESDFNEIVEPFTFEPTAKLLEEISEILEQEKEAKAKPKEKTPKKKPGKKSKAVAQPASTDDV